MDENRSHAPTVAGASDSFDRVFEHKQIGHYHLISQLGEGGFGVVYLAERREPHVQRVALKVIKPGMDSKAVIARFEQERQALAVMEHPNVAKVLDAGVTDDGRPYFVMEHVQGEPITDYSDRQRLTVKDRLRLFSQVCEAIQHAHLKGVIHRDIKPSNILVSGAPQGSDAVLGIPKVIDFGIAKAISHALIDKTIFTEQGQIVGTPEYMSPEQADMGATDIDTRTDVYSLGVLLYEMLTGVLPFEPSELRSKGYNEIQRIIREVDPPKPSTRLSSLGERGKTTAANRKMRLEDLAAELRRELEWIPLRAMRKDRRERYQTPLDLAGDIGAYLNGLPLQAGPESASYRLRKLIKRNGGLVIAGSAITLSLVVGLGTTLWQASLARAETIRADERAIAAEEAEFEALAARDQERRRAAELQSVSEFQSQMLRQIDTTQAGLDLMTDLRGRFAAAIKEMGLPEVERISRVNALSQELDHVNATDIAASMIDRTLLKPAVEAIDQQFGDTPAVEAQLRQALGDLYYTIGLYESAAQLMESALATRRRVFGEDHADTLISLSNMAVLLAAQGRHGEAEPYYRTAQEKRRRVLGEEHPETLISISNLGFLLQAQGKFDEAELYHREALEKRRRVLGEDHPDTLNSINNMGSLLMAQGKYDLAEPYHREVLEKARRVLGDEHPETLTYINNMGLLFDNQGRLDVAEPHYREAMEKRRRVLGEEHPSTLISVGYMGSLLHGQGKYDQAEPFYREALEKRRRVLGADHPDTLGSISALGSLLLAQGEFVEAERYFREALEKRHRVLGAEHPETLHSINYIGILLHSQGKLDQAEPYYREALEKRRRALGEVHPDTLSSINNLGAVLLSLGRLEQAEPYFRESLESRRRMQGDEHPETLIAISNLGFLLQSQGRLVEAEPFYRQALEGRRRTLGDDHLSTLSSMNNLGFLLQSQGRLAEAEPCYREALDGRRGALGHGHPETLTSAYLLASVLVMRDGLDETITLLEPEEAAARAAFNGGDNRRLGSFLKVLGVARAGLSFDPDRYACADANLLEAHGIFVNTRGPTHKDTRDCTQALVDLYTTWNEHEPNAGYDAKADEWRMKLAEIDAANESEAGNDG